MSFVAIKSKEQLDLQSLHRSRERLVTERTSLINQGRGFLMERGIRIGAARHVFQKELMGLAQVRPPDRWPGEVAGNRAIAANGRKVRRASIKWPKCCALHECQRCGSRTAASRDPVSDRNRWWGQRISSTHSANLSAGV